jgi:hypothetical protein
VSIVDEMVAERMAQGQASQHPGTPVEPPLAEQIATLHERLLKNADYQGLVALVDERIEYVTSTISERPRTIEEYLSLAGELRGLRAARGASTVKRGHK